MFVLDIWNALDRNGRIVLFTALVPVGGGIYVVGRDVLGWLFGIALGYEDLNDHDQLRLWFASMAYVLLAALRRIALAGTQFAKATCGSIRLNLLKIGALVITRVRRIKIAMASGYPWQAESADAYTRLSAAAA